MEERRPAVTPIRDATPDRDAAACLAIYAPFITDTVVSFEDEVPTSGEFAGRMRAIARTHPWLVYEDGGEVVGFAYASLHNERAAYRWAANVSAYVAASHRGRGVGRALYRELFERLKRRGFHVVCAGMTLPNEASERFHRALGFEPVGVYRRIGWKMGAWRDVAWCQRDLVPPGDAPSSEPPASR